MKNQGKTVKLEGQRGDIITGTASPKEKQPGPKTMQQKNDEIKNETKLGQRLKERINSKSWRGKQDGNQFIVGNDAGAFSWLTPLLCAFFGLVDCGYKKRLRIWNFPPSVDNPKKKHEVMFQYYYQIDGKYILVDAFDDKTNESKINLIKAWLEALGYRYTYLLGGDMERVEGDQDKFAELVFGKRLKVLNPKDKNYPKFKVPQTYAEAGLPYGQTNLVGNFR